VFEVLSMPPEKSMIRRQHPWRVVAAGLALAVAAAIAYRADTPASAESGQSASPPASSSRDIRHLEPRPDSVGPQPLHFRWSEVAAADSYTLRIWNEADVRVYSESGITTTSVDVPKDSEIPAGTYFWAVVGMRGEQPVAESGLAAFVVQTP
jgi:hypothetical protein